MSEVPEDVCEQIGVHVDKVGAICELLVPVRQQSLEVRALLAKGVVW